MSPAEYLALPRRNVEIAGPPFIRGELALADGTVLNVMLVVPGVTVVEGQKDPMGNPLSEIQTAVVVGVKSPTTPKGSGQ